MISRDKPQRRVNATTDEETTACTRVDDVIRLTIDVAGCVTSSRTNSTAWHSVRYDTIR